MHDLEHGEWSICSVRSGVGLRWVARSLHCSSVGFSPIAWQSFTKSGSRSSSGRPNSPDSTLAKMEQHSAGTCLKVLGSFVQLREGSDQEWICAQRACWSAFHAKRRFCVAQGHGNPNTPDSTPCCVPGSELVRRDEAMVETRVGCGSHNAVAHGQMSLGASCSLSQNSSRATASTKRPEGRDGSPLIGDGLAMWRHGFQHVKQTALSAICGLAGMRRTGIVRGLPLRPSDPTRRCVGTSWEDPIQEIGNVLTPAWTSWRKVANDKDTWISLKAAFVQKIVNVVRPPPVLCGWWMTGENARNHISSFLSACTAKSNVSGQRSAFHAASTHARPAVVGGKQMLGQCQHSPSPH